MFRLEAVGGVRSFGRNRDGVAVSERFVELDSIRRARPSDGYRLGLPRAESCVSQHLPHDGNERSGPTGGSSRLMIVFLVVMLR
jgi:hypothetical protein